MTTYKMGIDPYEPEEYNGSNTELAIQSPKSTIMDLVFDTEAIRERLKFLTDNPPKHYIGVVRDKKVNTLCLSRKIANTTEILLMKKGEPGFGFDEMLYNLKRYFDADIIEEL